MHLGLLDAFRRATQYSRATKKNAVTINETYTSRLLAWLSLSIFASPLVHRRLQEALKRPLTAFILPGYAHSASPDYAHNYSHNASFVELTKAYDSVHRTPL